MRLTKKAVEAFRKTLPEYRQHESYYFGVQRWDVIKGLYMISQWPAVYQAHRQKEFKPEDLMQIARIDPRPQWSEPDARGSRQLMNPGSIVFGRSVDYPYIDTNPEFREEPVLMGLWATEDRQGKPLLISILLDGAHRIVIAHERGLETIKAYILSPAELDVIEIK